MKRKQLYKTGILFLLLAGITYSCNLEENIYNQIAEDKVFQSEADILPFIAPGYSQLRRTFYEWHGWWMMTQYCTDEMVQPVRGGWAWYDDGVFIAMHKHTWTKELGVNYYYTLANDAITNLNRIIDVLEKSEVDVPEKLIAEMKTIRALNYYYLTDNFGNIPFITGFSELAKDTMPNQFSRPYVIQKAIDEIKANAALLSDEAPRGEYWGRMTKWGAYTILADIYLNHEIYTGTPMWDECITLCDSVIESGYFKLDDDFSTPFKALNENDEEHVFTIPFDEDFAGWLGFHQLSLSNASKETYDAQCSLWGGCQAVPSFFDSYAADDIRRDKTWITGVQYSASGQPIIADGDTLNYVNYCEGIENTGYFDGARFGKFEFYQDMKYMMKNDVPFYRYADVLLMKAEALLRRGNAGDKAMAVELVNKVRERAFEPDQPITESDLTLDRMLTERGWEFAGEGCRRQDQIRFGTFTTKSWDPDHEPSDEYHNIFPLPQSALDANPKLVQNPGYN
jgi:hypothetical protein